MILQVKLVENPDLDQHDSRHTLCVPPGFFTAETVFDTALFMLSIPDSNYRDKLLICRSTKNNGWHSLKSVSEGRPEYIQNLTFAVFGEQLQTIDPARLPALHETLVQTYDALLDEGDLFSTTISGRISQMNSDLPGSSKQEERFCQAVEFAQHAILASFVSKIDLATNESYFNTAFRSAESKGYLMLDRCVFNVLEAVKKACEETDGDPPLCAVTPTMNGKGYLLSIIEDGDIVFPPVDVCSAEALSLLVEKAEEIVRQERG
jgi:hypothetical protein